MRQLYVLLIVFSSINITSCKKVDSKIVENNTLAIEGTRIAEEGSDNSNLSSTKSLVKSGSLKIPLDQETSFYAENIQYINRKDQHLLVTLPLSSNTLNIYNLNSSHNDQIDKIMLQAEGPNSIKGEAGAFYYHNRDSIFVLSKFTFEVFLLNSEGKVKNSYPLLKDFDPKLPVPLGSTFSPLKFLDNKLYISCVAPKEQTQGDYEKSFIEYNIEQRKTFFRGRNPDKLNSGNWEGVARLYYDYDTQNEEFVLAFSISDEILKLDHLFNISEFKVESDYIKSNDAKPFSTDFKKAIDYVERGKYSFSTPKYWGILSDASRGDFYRIGIQPNSYSNFSKGIFPNIIIVVMDNEFNKILEQEMNPTNYQYDMSFIGENGLYIANKEKYNENDNFLTFDIFMIK